MHRPFSFAALAVLTTLVAAPSEARDTKAKAVTLACQIPTEQQVNAWFDAFNAAWAAKDPAKVTELFAKDAVLLATVANKPRTNPAEINDYFVSFLKGSPVGKIDTSTIKPDCRTVARLGTWTVTLTDATTGAKTDVKARYSFIYRFEDGQWKIAHLHSSMMPEKTT
jgi:uncharacterized protein (TIGR02246 family)